MRIYIHAQDHTCEILHACIHTYALTHTMSFTYIAHTHSFTLTRLLISLSHTDSYAHTHTLKFIHALTRKHTYMHTYMPLIILTTLPSSHSTHLTHLISLNSSHLCSYIYFFIFIYPSPPCFFIKLLTCGVIRSYNWV